MLRAIFITASLVVASPSVGQQVRVISGDIQHVYGPGGVVLDDAELRARNERAFEKRQTEKQLELERQQIEAQRALNQAASLAYDTGPWDLTYGSGFFVGRQRVHPRIGPSPRMGHFTRMR